MREKEQMDAQIKKKVDEDRMYDEYKKQQQDIYRQALDQQVSLNHNPIAIESGTRKARS